MPVDPIKFAPKAATVSTSGTTNGVAGSSSTPLSVTAVQFSDSVVSDPPQLRAALQDLVTRITEDLRGVGSFPLGKGILKRSVTIASSTCTIEHGLGKPVVWWLVVGQPANSPAPLLTMTATDTRTVTFTSSEASTTIDIYLVSP